MRERVGSRAGGQLPIPSSSSATPSSGAAFERHLMVVHPGSDASVSDESWRHVELSDVTIEWLEEHLSGWEGSGGQYAAWCPCHDDEGTSWKGLSISLVGKKVLLKCHSCGVQLPEVVEALNGGVVRETPVVNVRKHRSESKNKSQKTAQSSSSSSKEEHVRAREWWVDKTQIPWEVWEQLGCEAEDKEIHFLFTGYDVYKYRSIGGKEFGWSERGDNKPPLWPVPPDDLPKQIAITEGESDTGTARFLGYTSFAITKGAGKGEKRYLTMHEFEALKERGVKEVVLFGDMDESGREMLDVCSKSAVDAGLVVYKSRLEVKLDPFSGINDLNGIWCELKNKKQVQAIIDATLQRVATRYTTLTVESMLELAKEEVRWLVPTLIAPSDKGLISGPQKSLKTYLALDLARSLTTCQPFMQREEWTPRHPLRVHFVQEEGSPQLWAKRAERLQIPKKAPFTSWHREGIRFTDPSTIDEVISFCRDEGVQVLFLDPMQRMVPGVDENDSSATGVVWDEVWRIQHACKEIVVIILHHANKTSTLTWESVRGSSRHAGEVDFGIFVRKEPGDFPPGHGQMQVAVDGRDLSSDLSAGDAFLAKYFIGDTFALDAQETITVNVNPVKKQALANQDSVHNAIADGCATREAIISQTGLSEATVRGHIRRLLDEEKIEEEDHGQGKAKTYTVNDSEGDQPSPETDVPSA